MLRRSEVPVTVGRLGRVFNKERFGHVYTVKLRSGNLSENYGT